MPGTPERETAGAAEAWLFTLGTLTVFPVRAFEVNRRIAGRGMVLAPFAGVLLGATAAAVSGAAIWLSGSALLASVLAVGTLAWLTRCLHLDGLADLADGLGSGKPAGQALDIMKRSDIGPFGVVTLVFTLLAQVAALTRLEGLGPPALIAACAAGRLAITWSCRDGVPAARPGGLGAFVAGTVRRGPALAVTAAVLICAAVLLPALGSALQPHLTVPPSPGVSAVHPPDDQPAEAPYSYESYSYDIAPYAVSPVDETPLRSSVWWGPMTFPLSVLAGLGAAALLRRRAVRRLGGITGDVLGALVECATTTTLLVCAFLL
ncbi:adenosylcobinamide-GDP ribazoletransferase [Microtetraspora malaysiensis]|uniref:adenosylcobinamide-GDP ribazoletransferase n=1 Tax=Microtetraspora malaysiensis TaxID=161358 RepID=UPI000AB4B776|nr:adenosylcobinamide-GDP ribazoletransferase [Microtetraspora malaysiensis]